MKYKQELPADVEAALDAYIERIKAIKWFQPSSDIKREKVDSAVKVALAAFGVEASIEYRSLKTQKDWDAALDAAWGAARGAARDAARGAAWGAADILASKTPTYKLDTPFVKMVDIWEMGLYPIGVVDGKFVVYVPQSKLEFPSEFETL